MSLRNFDEFVSRLVFGGGGLAFPILFGTPAIFIEVSRGSLQTFHACQDSTSIRPRPSSSMSFNYYLTLPYSSLEAWMKLFLRSLN
jgi:hypothetical protein